MPTLIDAKVQWNRPGIEVAPGARLTIRYLEGAWTAHPAMIPAHGPQGSDAYVAKAGYALPGAPEGALVGKIGDNGPAFLIGAQADVPEGSSGPLFLSCNDDLAGQLGMGYSDNEGSFWMAFLDAQGKEVRAKSATGLDILGHDGVKRYAVSEGYGTQTAVGGGSPTLYPAGPSYWGFSRVPGAEAGGRREQLDYIGSTGARVTVKLLGSMPTGAPWESSFRLEHSGVGHEGTPDTIAYRSWDGAAVRAALRTDRTETTGSYSWRFRFEVV